MASIAVAAESDAQLRSKNLGVAGLGFRVWEGDAVDASFFCSSFLVFFSFGVNQENFFEMSKKVSEINHKLSP